MYNLGVLLKGQLLLELIQSWGLREASVAETPEIRLYSIQFLTYSP